jgi:DNA (cytosine-5)-methyltransferase 1
MRHPQFILNLATKLVIVFFAGAGGSCTGIEKAIGRHVDYAVNHNEGALSCHQANHPQTKHLVEDVWHVDPYRLAAGRAVGYMHFSPDCTHFSQAKGGQPRSGAIRSLPWVTVKWCGTVRPEVFTLENVKEIRKWGPLIAKRDKATGRVIKLDGTVAAEREHVPRQLQYLIPDPKRIGQTWKRYCVILRGLGYEIDDRVLCAADYDVPQQRNRLFQIGRCDGKPITWPDPVRTKEPGKVVRAARQADGKPVKPLPKWRAAYECIHWSIKGTSIFGRKRPLAPATMTRIARGMDKFVLNNADPFIVPVTHQGDSRLHSIREPLPTVTTAQRGEFMVAAPVLVQASHGEGKAGGVKRRGMGARDLRSPAPTLTASGSGGQAVATAFLAQYHAAKRPGDTRASDLGSPLPTQDTSNRHSLVTAYLAQMNGGFNDERGTPGHDLREPTSTVNAKGSGQMLVAGTLAQLRNHCDARDLNDPLQVVSAGGEHHVLITANLVTNTSGHAATDLRDAAPTIATGGHQMLVEYQLSPDDEAGALRCAAFIMEYYSSGGQWSDLRQPFNTVTTKDRLALVTVWIKGDPYVVVDICIRMLTPRELATASSLPAQYVLNRGHDGRAFTKSQQVFFIGNCVPPELQYHVTRVNYQDEPERMLEAA